MKEIYTDDVGVKFLLFNFGKNENWNVTILTFNFHF